MEAVLHKTVNRSAAPRPAPAAVPVHAASPTGVQLQSALRISSPRDPAEREAEATAAKIMRMPAPAATSASGEGGQGVLRSGVFGGGPAGGAVHRKLESPYIARFAGSIAQMQRSSAAVIARREDGAAGRGAADIRGGIAQSGPGSPLPEGVRSFMEPRFGANFGAVRIHTGETSAQLNRQVSAQAFTVGNQIFFGKDRFRPESHEGKELIAHELTHTIQQGAVQQGSSVQRREDVGVTSRSAPQVQRLGISDALDYFAGAANAIPGYRMFTILLGVNPINMARVERSAANILRAIVEFLPGGVLITRALDAYGVFDTVGTWVERQLATLGLSGSVIRDSINRFLDSLSWRDIFRLGSVWDRARRIFTDPIDRLLAFGRSLFSAILRFIRDAVLRPLAALASRTRAWDLLCAVLGTNPITGEAVPRTAETLIGGFMRLIGQEEIWQNIQRGNAIGRAWAWFQGAIGGLLGFVRQIPGLFLQTLQSLTIEDFVVITRAFGKVAGVFGSFIGNFLSWAGDTVWNLLEIIFSVVAPSVMVYLRRAASAFRTILRDPIGFVRNLVRAGMQGFRQFASRFLTHLRGALIGWLTGAMSGANIYIPQGFTLREILKFVLSVLGLTWQNIRQKLVRAIGETAVRVLETGFDIVVTLVTQGPAAAWEKIQESLSNLRELVIEQVMTFVRDRVVTAAVTRLVSMLSPAGAFIQAIIATYNTVMFFVERLRQIAQVAASFIDSIAAIAAGNIAAAANRVEQTMAGLLTLVISFLARIAGLGRVADAVTNVVNRVRQPIDRALDRVVDWIVATARRLGRLVASGARAAVARIANWWRLRRQFTDEAGQQHSLSFRGQDRSAQLIVESVPRPVAVFLAEAQRRATQPENERYRPFLRAAFYAAGQVTPVLDQIIAASGNAERVAQLNTTLDARMEALARALRPLLAMMGEGATYGGLRDPRRLNQIELQQAFIYTPPAPGREYRSSEGEFARQLQLQEGAINNMKVDRWQANVQAFANRASSGADPRDAEGTRRQAQVLENERNAFVARAIQARRDAYVARGMSEREAGIAAQRFVNLLTERVVTATNRSRYVRHEARDPITQEMIQNEVYRRVALHRLDQVAGGEGTDIVGLGGESEDKSIGKQWKIGNPNRIDQLRRGADDQIRALRIRPDDLRILFMHVRLPHVTRS